jgi:hypothetical protein
LFIGVLDAIDLINDTNKPAVKRRSTRAQQRRKGLGRWRRVVVRAVVDPCVLDVPHYVVGVVVGAV